MTTLSDLMGQPAVAALAWTLIHFLWQGALVGGAAFVALRVVRPRRATTRYAISVATLVVMLLTAVTTFVFVQRQPVGRGESGIVAAAMAAPAVLPPAGREAITLIGHTNESFSVRSPWPFAPIDPALLPLVVVAWGLGVVAMLIRLTGGWIVTRRLAADAAAAAPPAVAEMARRLAHQLDVRRAVAIRESQAVAVPTLIGWLKPVVLLPAAALAGLSPEQLHAILAHELAHVRRHDYLVNLLQSVVETLLFYHPATWWVSARIRAEREHCCDDLAVEICGDRLVYASALAELTALGGPRGLALAATDGSLLNRVRRILGGPRSKEPAPVWPLLALVLAFAATGSFNAGAIEQMPAPRLAAAAHAIWAVVPQAIPEPPQRQGLAEPEPPQPPQPEPPEPPKPEPAEPPQPPEPPAPPEPPRQDFGSRGSGNMSWSNDHERFSVRWTGAFRISEDEKDIEWMEDGATLTITDGMVLTSRVELRGRGTGIERQYWRNGVRRDYEPEGREFLAAALGRMIRQTGAFAKQRVARFLGRGGPDAVLAEIDRLSDSSYVRRVYYSELLTQASPSDALLDRVLRRAATDLKSDHDKATLLMQAAQSPAMNDSHRVTIARAVQSISSDYNQRRTLIAILNTRPLAAAVATAALEASESIGSSHDRSLVLLAFVEHGGLTPATTPAFMAQVRRLSSYDQRRVLVSVSSNATLAGPVAVEAVRAAGDIPSAHDQSTALISLIDRGGVTEATAGAFFEAAGRITSAHDLSRVLLRLLERRDTGGRLVDGVLRTAPKIGSSHNRAQVLIAVAGRGPLSGEARQLYIAASRNLGSHDENRVLAALVRAEAQ